MNRPALLDLYANLCEHHAADVARNDANELEPRTVARFHADGSRDAQGALLPMTCCGRMSGHAATCYMRSGPAVTPDASFSEAEPTEPDAAIAAERAASEARIRFLNAQMLGDWIARAGVPR